MRVLVACEYSATVRDAFRALGHDAYSCDLLPTDGDPKWHIQGDAIFALTLGRFLVGGTWDLVIAHPPCTYLTSAGLHWNKRPEHWRGQVEPGETLTNGERERVKAIAFIRAIYDSPIKRVAIENPIGALTKAWRKPDQIIQPWQFGDPESKATCLWLKGLPLLQHTNVLPLPEGGRWANQTPSGQNKLGPSADRWKIRSKTYAGIAQAMAAQWGKAA